MLFVCVKLFCKKKIKKSKITPDNLMHYTTESSFVGTFLVLYAFFKQVNRVVSQLKI